MAKPSTKTAAKKLGGKKARSPNGERADVVVRLPSADQEEPSSPADRIKFRLNALVAEGWKLYIRFVVEFLPEQARGYSKETLDLVGKERFTITYQSWYSEALRLLRQALPERVADFENLYRPIRQRKEIDYENYTISDALVGLQSSLGGQVKVQPRDALARVKLQIEILASAKGAIESHLYDIRTLLFADVIDSEIDAAEELIDKGFVRAAGVIVGVVLEGHLASVARSHSVTIKAANPTIAALNDALRSAGTIDLVTWRRIQGMADVRNNCGHSRLPEPSKDDVKRLIADVKDIVKRVS